MQAEAVSAEAREAVIDEFAALMRAIHFGGSGCAIPWAGIDLTLPQLKLLGLLASRPRGMHGRELASALGVGPSAVTALVERIVEPGYARREEDPHDRRITWVRVTDQGRALAERMATGRREQLSQALSRLDPDELATVHTALRILRRAAEAGAA